MTLGASLAALQAESAQCATLIANAHRTGATGAPLFSAAEREMITTAAFLNSFKLWERFLEESIAKYLSGKRPIGKSLVLSIKRSRGFVSDLLRSVRISCGTKMR
jgi:hypothetical protein